MSKITFENIKGKSSIINRLSYPETINERVYQAIASGMFEGFLPMSIHQKRQETRIECNVSGLIPLTKYFDFLVSKKIFLDFVHEIALQVKNCEKNMINPNNLDLQMDRIFVDPNTKRIKCIFWPVVNNQRENPPHLFLKSLPFELDFNPYEDSSYLKTYIAFFGGIDPFSVNSFDRMVLTLAGKESAGVPLTPFETLSGGLGGDAKPEKKDLDAKRKENIEYDPFSDNSEHTDERKEEGVIMYNDTTSVFCSHCGTKNQRSSNFCILCGTKLKKEEPAQEEKFKNNGAVDNTTINTDTVVLGDASGGTTVLGGYGIPKQPIYPSLIRLRTGKAYSVDKPRFRIGAAKMSCDLFISDNNYISRNHADIITRNDRYYIVDRKSTNKTYVDGRVIASEREVELFAGTKIRLANEDFIFNIENVGD